MQPKITICAALTALGLAAEPASAQPVPPALVPGGGVALPPYEIITIVRSTGLEPLGRPVRQGPAYALRAVDRAGREVLVIADARMGRIVRVVPGPRYALAPGPSGRPPGPIAAAPDGPNPRIATLPPAVGGPPLNGPALATAPNGPMFAPAAGAPPRVDLQLPPLPRPRPKANASAESGAASQPSATRVDARTGSAPPARPTASAEEMLE